MKYAIAMIMMMSVSSANAQTFWKRSQTEVFKSSEPTKVVEQPVVVTTTPSPAKVAVPLGEYKFSRYRYGLFGRPRSKLEIKLPVVLFPY